MENSKAEVRFTWARKKLPIDTLLSVSNVVLIGKRGGEIRFHAHGNRVYGALQFTPSHSRIKSGASVGYSVVEATKEDDGEMYYRK